MIPGEIKFFSTKKIEINKNRHKVSLIVKNNGDRPIQVGSHYHFYEVNSALKFNRKKSKGYRLDIPSGTSIRFEPNQKRKIFLVEISGKKKIWGFKKKIMGILD